MIAAVLSLYGIPALQVCSGIFSEPAFVLLVLDFPFMLLLAQSILAVYLFAVSYRILHVFVFVLATVSRWGAASPTPRCAVSSEGNRAAAKVAWHRRLLACP